MSEQARRASNRDRALAYLRLMGKATNVELAQEAGLRFGARLHEARAEGHKIRTELGKNGLVTYVYDGFDPHPRLPL